jgi:excisionase family DNA binding protein
MRRTDPDPDGPIILNTAEQAAAVLGVDRKTVLEAVRRRAIPHRRLRRRLLFERGLAAALGGG